VNGVEFHVGNMEAGGDAPRKSGFARACVSNDRDAPHLLMMFKNLAVL